MRDYENRISEFRVSIHEHNTFLHDLLLKKYDFFSRAEWDHFVSMGNLTIDGKIILDNVPVRLGQVIKLVFPNSKEPRVNKNFKIIFEDDHMLVIDKPSNLPMHPAGKYYGNTLINLLKHRHPNQDFWIVNRLDRDTCGICIIAKTKEALLELQKQFLWNRVKKEYNLISIGTVKQKEFIVKKKLKEVDKTNPNKRVVVDEYGKDAQTRFELLHVGKFTIQEGPVKYEYNYSVLNAFPLQGRTHQIRVHISSVGHPILNDKLYSKNFCVLNSPMYLKCTYMKFAHPTDGDMEFRLPPFEYTELQF